MYFDMLSDTAALEVNNIHWQPNIKQTQTVLKSGAFIDWIET